jgi:hypothetical protein
VAQGMTDLQTKIAEYMSLCAEASEKFGTDLPEDNDSIPEELR